MHFLFFQKYICLENERNDGDLANYFKVLKQPGMTASISDITEKLRNMKLFRVFLLTGLFLGLNKSLVSAQCTVTGVSGSGFNLGFFVRLPIIHFIMNLHLVLLLHHCHTYRVLFIWGDGNTDNIWAHVQTKLVGATTVYYVRADKDHTFPAAGNCEYTVNIILVDNGFQCPDSRQVQIIANWHEDDVAAASGVISLNPTPRHDVCVGLPLVDFRFSDASVFACNLQQYPLAQKPNHTTRYQQYVYGTNPVAGRGIPNLFIKVGTLQTLVRLTDGAGVPVANSWTVNPTTGAAVPAYPTVSGYFEGPVVAIPVDAVTGTYTKPQTYPILFDGVGTAFQDQFQVTLRNWNTCNPWNGSQTNPNSAIANTATALIYIVNGPLANAGADAKICANSTYTMNGSVTNATSSLWTTPGNGSFTNATSPNGAVYTPGSNRYNGRVCRPGTSCIWKWRVC